MSGARVVAIGLLLAASAVPSGAKAQFVMAEVPLNATIMFGGLQWAWASPATWALDLSYQSQFGWRLPTAAELAARPLASDFIFEGANVDGASNVDPVSGAYWSLGPNVDAACASPYFNSSYMHCDYNDGNEGRVSTELNTSAHEVWVVRSEKAETTVPEPLSMVLLGTGLAGVAAARRRRQAL